MIVYSLGFFDKFSFFTLNKTKFIQNQLVVAGLFFSACIIFATASLYYDTIDFSFLNDPRAWASIFLEITGYKIAKYNYKIQDNYTVIAFGQMASIWLIYILTYFLDPIFGYDTQTLNLSFKTSAIIAGAFFLLTIAYFYDKLKLNTIKHPFALAVFSLSMATTMYFAIRNMQHYQLLTFYGTILFSVGFVHLFESFRSRKEILKFRRVLTHPHRSVMFKFCGIYFTTTILNMLAILFLAVEYFTIFKRAGQLSAAIFIDKIKYGHKLLVKDIFVILAILGFAFYLFLIDNPTVSIIQDHYHESSEYCDC